MLKSKLSYLWKIPPFCICHLFSFNEIFLEHWSSRVYIFTGSLFSILRRGLFTIISLVIIQLVFLKRLLCSRYSPKHFTCQLFWYSKQPCGVGVIVKTILRARVLQSGFEPWFSRVLAGSWWATQSLCASVSSLTKQWLPHRVVALNKAVDVKRLEQRWHIMSINASMVIFLFFHSFSSSESFLLSGCMSLS